MRNALCNLAQQPIKAEKKLKWREINKRITSNAKEAGKTKKEIQALRKAPMAAHETAYRLKTDTTKAHYSNKTDAEILDEFQEVLQEQWKLHLQFGPKIQIKIQDGLPKAEA